MATRVPHSPPPHAPVRSTLRAALTEDLGLKGVALVLAVLLWLLVGARTPTEAYITVRIEPDLDSSLALLDGTPHVRALVQGREADLVKLYAAPPVVRRAISGDAPDTLVLDITPADVHIAPELSNDIRVLDVQPRNVTLRFESRASRRIEVVNGGRIVVLGGRRAVRFDPETIRITGPRAAVRRVASLRPLGLNIADGDTMPHLAELDTAGLGIRAHPAQVRVRAVVESAQ